MTALSEQYSVVELEDAAAVQADVLVIPSTSQGSFGEPWQSIVGNLGMPSRTSPIPHGGIKVYPSQTSHQRVRYVAFAASVDGQQPTDAQVIAGIGAALGRLTTDSRYPDIREIATPVLGTGVGQLDPALSLEALVAGFASTSPVGRLRIIESDRKKYLVLAGALAGLATAADRPPAERGLNPPSMPPTWQELGPDARLVMETAEGLITASGSTEIHMEHLVIATYRVVDEPRALFGQLSIAGLVEIAQQKSGLTFPATAAVPLTAMPALSTHVIDALTWAQRIAGNPDQLTAADILAGALRTDCDFIALLLREGVGANSSSNNGEPEQLSVRAEPSADTIPDRDVALHDRLNLGREVDMLASVMLASNTPLPLAIGLFGDWGSGKSFFMRMLDERIHQLARSESEVRDDQPVFCRHIRQVHFNAWHYVDGNLWASLASTIFDGLVDRPDSAVQEQKQDELGEATKRAIAASEARIAAERSLRVEQQKVGRLSTIVGSAVPAAVAALRDSADLQEQLDSDGRSLSESADRFVAAADAARSAGRQAELFRGLLKTELANGRRRATLSWLTVAVALVVGVFLLGSFEIWTKVLIGAAAVLSSLGPALAATMRLLSSAQQARQRREQPVVAAQNRLADAEHAERLANEEVADRQAELERLRDRGARLQDLVRAARLEYGAHLGMISQLRKDFEQLTWLLNSRSDTSRQLKQAAAELCLDGTSPATDGGDSNARTSDVLNVDRIVLYIDDLDRCPAKEVVKVLQAVNLLLTFRLFVVVIGVDGRWLEASLSSHYDTLLRSPVEYLEKIIQLPFVLRPMGPDAYLALVDDLTSARRSDAHRAGTAGQPVVTEESPSDDTSARPSGGVDDGSSVGAADPGDIATPPGTTIATAAGSANAIRLPRSESLVISAEERELMGKA
ncbi:MAG: P-loop NTPase fold protein, partial [Nakamurella sp.]